jgi:uncharacterized SAM-dependent methyltransferase
MQISQECNSASTIGTLFDIGWSRLSDTLRSLLNEKLLWKDGKQHWQRLLPSALLSDDVGLQLWNQINRLPNYYHTRDEIELLGRYGAEIAGHIGEGGTIVDLGAGWVLHITSRLQPPTALTLPRDVRKVRNLLDSFELEQKSVQYYAFDLSKPCLEESMKQLTPNYKFVKCFGLWGTFDNDLTWSRTMSSPNCYLSLGSIFGNDYFEPAVSRLSVWAKAMSPQDRMLLGMDARENLEEVWDAFHDAEGLFERFIRNGLVHTNKVLGESWYRDEDWNIAGILQENPTTHRFVITTVRDVLRALKTSLCRWR